MPELERFSSWAKLLFLGGGTRDESRQPPLSLMSTERQGGGGAVADPSRRVEDREGNRENQFCFPARGEAAHKATEGAWPEGASLRGRSVARSILAAGGLNSRCIPERPHVPLPLSRCRFGNR